MGRAEDRERLGALLVRNRELRSSAMLDDVLASALPALQRWQADRLARTYADLRREDRYREAVTFFLSDLYGPVDFARRDADLLRVYRVMSRLLPPRALEALCLAVELESLTQALDADVARLHGTGVIDAASYARAYRAADRQPDRERQIELVLHTGRYLDELVSHPLIHTAIRIARKPAHAAGFGSLQEFLEHGFDAFNRMAGAEVLLRTIEIRETRVMERLFAGDPDPFRLEDDRTA